MSEKKQYGLLVDYTFFSGNHGAEIACKEEMGLAEGQWGIKEVKVGPFKIGEGNDGDDWEWFYIPCPTSLFSAAWADGGNGGTPLAVQVEESNSMYYGTMEELQKKQLEFDRPTVLFAL